LLLGDANGMWAAQRHHGFDYYTGRQLQEGLHDPRAFLLAGCGWKLQDLHHATNTHASESAYLANAQAPLFSAHAGIGAAVRSRVADRDPCTSGQARSSTVRGGDNAVQPHHEAVADAQQIGHGLCVPEHSSSTDRNAFWPAKFDCPKRSLACDFTACGNNSSRPSRSWRASNKYRSPMIYPRTRHNGQRDARRFPSSIQYQTGKSDR
jgi:hypothetical protein